jgi:hypothetical protein
MSILSDFSQASTLIPATIKIGFQHSSSNQLARYTILKEYESLVELLKAILFYSYLFQNIDATVYYDDFSYIPITYDEIETLAYYGNTLDKSIVKGKLLLYPNQFQLKLIS